MRGLYFLSFHFQFITALDALHSSYLHAPRCDRYWTAFYPADTVKSYIQTDPRFTSSSVYQVGKDIYKEHGFSGLYRGWVRSAPL